MSSAWNVVATLFVVALLSPIGAAQFGMWVVDDDGGVGVDFTSVQAAIEAASDNDVIVIREGVYDAFSIDGDNHPNALALTAEVDALVVIEGQTRIADLSVDAFVSVRGLRLEAQPGLNQHGLLLEDNAGAVWIENSTLIGSDDLGFLTSAGSGFWAIDCNEVILTRCVVDGGTGFTDGFGNGLGAAAVVTFGTQLALYETIAKGGMGNLEIGAQCPCALAGPAVYVSDGLVFAKSSVLTGGAGDSISVDPCPFLFCSITSQPASGLVLRAASQAWLFDSAVAAGGGGSVDDIDVEAGSSLTTLPGVARSFAITSPVMTGETVDMEFSGSPGDFAYVVISFGPEFILAPQYNGVWQLGAGGRIIPLLSIPAGGTLSLPFTGPALDPGLEALPISVQAAFEVASGVFFLAEPARVVVLAAE